MAVSAKCRARASLAERCEGVAHLQMPKSSGTSDGGTSECKR